MKAGAETQTIPEAQATVSVSLTKLAELPDGALYRDECDRASIELKRDGDMIRATGHCDSINRLYMWYIEESVRQGEMIDSLSWELERSKLRQSQADAQIRSLNQEKQSEKKNPPNRWWLWGTIGFVGGICAGIYSPKLKTKLQSINL